MLRLGLFCLLLAAVASSYPYNNFCQSRCQPQLQPQQYQPQICGSYCGGYAGGYGGGYGGGFGGGYGAGYWGGNVGGCAPCCNGCPSAYQAPPIAPPVAPSAPIWNYPNVEYQNPFLQSNTDPIMVIAGPPITQRPIRLACPADPIPRAGGISNSENLIGCNSDLNCPSGPVPHKCCDDSGVGGRVCKPAVRVQL